MILAWLENGVQTYDIDDAIMYGLRHLSPRGISAWRSNRACFICLVAMEDPHRIQAHYRQHVARIGQEKLAAIKATMCMRMVPNRIPENLAQQVLKELLSHEELAYICRPLGDS